jgi:hypothetical protein
VIITVAILATIMGAVFVAVDPVRRLNESRNARRAQDIDAIAKALTVGFTDIKSSGQSLTTVLPFIEDLRATEGTWHVIGTCAAAPATCGPDGIVATSCMDVSALRTLGSIQKIPTDPAFGSDEMTGYAIRRIDGRYDVRSCASDGMGSGGNGAAPLIETTVQ